MSMKYKEWLTEESLILIEGWAREGCTDRMIAERMGIAEKTLNEWKQKYSQISVSLKNGKEVVDFKVENALLKEALSGNVTAMIFWLKNRKPDKWRDKGQEVKDESIDKVDEMLSEIKGIAHVSH